LHNLPQDHVDNGTKIDFYCYDNISEPLIYTVRRKQVNYYLFLNAKKVKPIKMYGIIYYNCFLIPF